MSDFGVVVVQTPLNSTTPPSGSTRRVFLKRSVATAVTLGLVGRTAGSAEIGQTKVIDCHAHLHHHSRATWEVDDRKLIEAADQLDIEQLCCSILTPRRPATAE